MSILNTTSLQERLAAKIEPQAAALMKIESPRATGVTFTDMGQVMDFARMMAVSDIGVRKHLRGNVGACLAVTVQAVEWGMSPFAIASKSYLVNDVIAYEAQLLNAVILRRAPIIGRFMIDFTGVGDKRVCKVALKMRDGGPDAVYVSPEFSKIQPKNSPLWKTDPDQQHFYNSSRALCRRHFPDVLLGVYTPDEILDGVGLDDSATVIRPAKPIKPAKDLGDRLSTLVQGVTIENEPAEADAYDPDTGEVAGYDPDAGDSAGQGNPQRADATAAGGEVAPQGAGGSASPQGGAGDASASGADPAPSDSDAESDEPTVTELIADGTRAAEAGKVRLAHYFGGLTQAQKDMIPKPVVEGWQKTAKAKSAGQAGQA